MFQLHKIDRSSIWFLLVVLTAIVFPWHERISSIAILLLVLHWLVDRDLAYKVKSIKLTTSMLLSFALFIITIVGLAWSSYRLEGMHSIEVKLVFLLLPILFSTENYLNKERRNMLEWTFIGSCSLAFIYCIVVAYMRAPHIPISALFQRMTISDPIMHPGYLSNYFAFGFVLITLKFMRSSPTNLKLRAGLATLGLYFLVVLFVLISKTAILFLMIYSIYIIWCLSAVLNKNNFVRIIATVVFLFSTGILLYQVPTIYGRAQEINALKTELKPADVMFWNSTAVREVAWKLEWELVKQKPILGYGTGASNPILLASLKEHGYDDLVKHNMHTHNQFLHTWLDVGLLGISILLSWLVYTAYYFIFKLKNAAGFWMIVLIFVNLLTDDMLEIQAGVVFFVFFTTLFLFKNSSHTRKLRYTY